MSIKLEKEIFVTHVSYNFDRNNCTMPFYVLLPLLRDEFPVLSSKFSSKEGNEKVL